MKPAADTRAGFEKRNARFGPRGGEPIGAISAGHAAAGDDEVVPKVVFGHDDIGTCRTVLSASANLARGLPVRRLDPGGVQRVSESAHKQQNVIGDIGVTLPLAVPPDDEQLPPNAMPASKRALRDSM